MICLIVDTIISISYALRCRHGSSVLWSSSWLPVKPGLEAIQFANAATGKEIVRIRWADAPNQPGMVQKFLAGAGFSDKEIKWNLNVFSRIQFYMSFCNGCHDIVTDTKKEEKVLKRKKNNLSLFSPGRVRNADDIIAESVRGDLADQCKLRKRTERSGW